MGLCDLTRDVLEHMLVHFGGAREAASLARTCREMREVVMGGGGVRGGILGGWARQRREDDVLPEGIGGVGGVVTIYGVVRMTREVRVGPGVHLTVRGGRIVNSIGRASDEDSDSDSDYEDEEPPYAFVVEQGGSLVLEDVRMVGADGGRGWWAGVRVSGGGTARLVGCDVRNAEWDAIVVGDQGSRVQVEGGSVSVSGPTGYDGPHGIIVKDGAHAVVTGVQMTGSVLVRDSDSVVEIVGGSVTGVGPEDGHGISVENGGTARLVGCNVLDAPDDGVHVAGQGSRVQVEGGSVSRSGNYGISVQRGGHAEMKDVRIEDNHGGGVYVGDGGAYYSGVAGQGSRAVVEGGSVRGTRAIGISVWRGGHAEMKGVRVEGTRTGVCVRDPGSQVEIVDGSVTGCACEGIVARAGGHARMKAVRVEGNKKCGVFVDGQVHGDIRGPRTTRAEAEGGSVSGSGCYGIRAGHGGHAVMKDVRVEDSQWSGVYVYGQGSRVEVEGGSVSGSGDSGICAEQGGHAVVKGVRVKDNDRHGVYVIGSRARVEVEGGSVSGSKEYHGICARLGAHAAVKDVQVRDNGGGIVKSEGGVVTVDGLPMM